MDITLLKSQYNFLFSEKRHTAIVGGYGSGKTNAGVIKTIYQKIANNNKPVAYYLPTYGLIKKNAMPRFKSILSDMGIGFTAQENLIKTTHGEIWLISMDNPEALVGYEVSYSLIDEADILPKHKMKEAYKNIKARCRLPVFDNKGNAIANKTDFVGTPEGYKFLYDFFKDEHKDKCLIRARTDDNIFLPKDFVNDLRAEYSAELVKAYLEGEFVNLTTGNVYLNYSRFENNIDTTIKDTNQLFIGLDFNIGKMCAIVSAFINGRLHIIDEIVNFYDTFAVCDEIVKRYTGYQVSIFPDASCKQRSTSGVSDYDILKSYGFNIVVGGSNPLVRDRINAVNVALCSGNGIRSLLVNSNRCRNLSEALEAHGYDKNGEPDKKSGHDHICDALGYVVVEFFKPKRTVRLA